jgi:proline dehydrogenase
MHERRHLARLSRRLLFRLATSEGWERTVRSIPGGGAAAFQLASRYVAGTGRQDALDCAWQLAGRDISASIDFFGESVEDPIAADRVSADYVDLAAALTSAPEGTFLSIDLSHLALDRDRAGVRRRLESIAAALPSAARIQIGAEDAYRAGPILDIVLAAARSGVPLVATTQANLKRAPGDAAKYADAGVPIRLVKGAYVEKPDIAIPWGEPTDNAFVGLARDLHSAGAELILATHDPALLSRLLPALPGVGVEFLLGVRLADADELVSHGIPVRVYVPYGPDWFRYAMRRFAEARGA